MLFVSEYLIDLNAGQAAMRTGIYSTIESARVQGHRMRHKAAVSDAIAKAMSERIGVTRSRVLEEIQRLAFSNIADVLTIEDGEVVVKDFSKLDRETLSTISEVTEVVNEKGYRTIRVNMHDRHAAIMDLARVAGMLINKTELSGTGGGPVEVDQTIDHSARIRSRLDEIAKRLPAPTERPIIDVTPQAAKPSALLAARIQTGKREE